MVVTLKYKYSSSVKINNSLSLAVVSTLVEITIVYQ